MNNFLNIAHNIIDKAFEKKFDKGGQPYVEHLQRVSANSRRFYKGDTLENEENQLQIIGLLHDLIEDCPEWTVSHLDAIFSDKEISKSIDLLTKKQGQSYEEYIDNIKDNDFARAVKLADLNDNMNLTRLDFITDKNIERIKKYHKSFKYLHQYGNER